MKREQFISFFFIAALIFVIYQIFCIFAPFFTSIFWSGILAFSFYPVYARLKKKFPKQNNVIALLMTLAVFLIVIPPFVIILINMAKQAVEFSQWAYNFIREGRIEILIEKIRTFSWFQNIESHVFQWEPLKNNVSDWLLGLAKALGNVTAAHMGTLTKNAFFVLLNLFFMVFLTFIFFKHGERIYTFIYEISPFERETKKALFRQIHETFIAVIRGQLLTSLVQAAAAGLVYWVLGLPIPLFFAFLTFITSLVPFLGAASVWVPLTIFLFLSHLYTQGVILLVLGFLISLLDNIIKPAVIGEKTKLPYFLLFFGIMGGMKLYGLMGIFLAPVILSIFFAFIKIYREKYI